MVSYELRENPTCDNADMQYWCTSLINWLRGRNGHISIYCANWNGRLNWGYWAFRNHSHNIIYDKKVAKKRVCTEWRIALDCNSKIIKVYFYDRYILQFVRLDSVMGVIPQAHVLFITCLFCTLGLRIAPCHDHNRNLKLSLIKLFLWVSPY